MLVQLTLASGMVVVVVIIHLLGLALLVRALRTHYRMFRQIQMTPLLLLVVASLGLFALHTLEIWLYAALYLFLGAVSHFEAALYYSTVTYASIGYGDVLLPHDWRILGAIEGVTGIMMLGWSTAFLVSLLGQLKLLSHDWLSKVGAGAARPTE